MKLKQYRKKNGKKLEGEGLAKAIASEIRGMVLAGAFIKAKSAGLKFRVMRYNGQDTPPSLDKDALRLNVDVAEGIVSKAWLG